MSEKMLTKKEVANYLRVGPRTVQSWIDSGELEGGDVRATGATLNHWRVPWGDFLAFCKNRKFNTENWM